jgi:dolichyl-phosphate beta-glucosyltransferase
MFVQKRFGISISDDAPSAMTHEVTPPPLLSIVVPARNESALIARTIARLDAALTELGVSYEIVISDSASSDATASIVTSLQHPHVRLVRNALAGKGRAIAAGMQAARGSVIGFIDADLEIDPSFIKPLFDAVRDGADFAIGVKNLPDPQRSALRRASTFCYNAFVRALLDTPFSDHQAGLKLFRAERVQALLPRLTSHGWFWDTEMLFALHRAGARGAEVGIRTQYQRPSQVGFLRVSAELLFSSLQLRLARRHPRRGLR